MLNMLSMMTITDQDYERLMNEALNELPERFIKHLDNVAIVYEDEPTPEQREKLKLRCDQTLFGLYEGVPRTQRAGFMVMLPDKITLFKLPMLMVSTDEAELKKQVKHTLWHEIAHYFGLNHQQIHSLESKMK